MLYVNQVYLPHLIIIIIVSGITYHTVLNMRRRSQSHLVVGPSNSGCLILANEGIVKKANVGLPTVKHRD